MLLTERQLRHKEKKYKYLLCYQQERITSDSEYVEYAIQAYLNKHNHKNIMFQCKWAYIWVVLCTSIYESFTRWVYCVCFYYNQHHQRVDHWTSSKNNK